jgi:hypothetical protein
VGTGQPEIGRQLCRLCLDLNQRGPCVVECGAEGGCEFVGTAHEQPERPKGLRVGDKVGIAQIGLDYPARVGALLVHADRPEHRVVDDDHNHAQSELDGGGEFAAAHEQASVAGEADHGALPVDCGRSQSSWLAVAHRAVTWSELGAEPAELEEALDPDGVVAGAGGDHRVIWSVLADVLDDPRES